MVNRRPGGVMPDGGDLVLPLFLRRENHRVVSRPRFPTDPLRSPGRARRLGGDGVVAIARHPDLYHLPDRQAQSLTRRIRRARASNLIDYLSALRNARTSAGSTEKYRAICSTERPNSESALSDGRSIGQRTPSANACFSTPSNSSRLCSMTKSSLLASNADGARSRCPRRSVTEESRYFAPLLHRTRGDRGDLFVLNKQTFV
jgi:hypothetical protein